MDLNQLWEQVVKDAPLVGALIYVAHTYMKKNEDVVDKLINAFKSETEAARKTNDKLLEHILESRCEDKP